MEQPGVWRFENSFFRQQIRRINRNRILLALAVLTLMSVLYLNGVIYQTVYYFQGVADVTGEELAAVTDPKTQLSQLNFPANYENSQEFEADRGLKLKMLLKDGRCRLRFLPENVVPSGIADVENGAPVGVVYEFAQLPNGKWMLLKRSYYQSLGAQVGTVGYLPEDLKILMAQSAGIDPAELAPILFDATGETFVGMRTDWVLSALALAAWGLWMFLILRRSRDYTKDPAYDMLYPLSGAVEDNVRWIDQELAGPDTVRSFGNIVTPHWRLQVRPFRLTIEKREDVD